MLRIPFSTRKVPPYLSLYHLLDQKSKLSRNPKMVKAQANSRRLVCPSCSKPVLICLCARIQNPGLENSVSVTILQHSLEKKHPLNSARIAKLGLKNVAITTVSDVNFSSRFIIQLQQPNSEVGPARNGLDGLDFEQFVETRETQKRKFENVGAHAECPDEKNSNLTNRQCKLSTDHSEAAGLKFVQNSFPSVSNATEPVEPREEVDIVESKGAEVKLEDTQECTKEAVITASIGKYGVINSLSHIWVHQTNRQNEDPDFDELLKSPAALDALAKGFTVKKLQKRKLKDSMELEEFTEFKIEVPPKSLLLFPSEKAFGVDSLHDNGFEVKNLIVLDGTWAKAKRMYNENPWLKLLPHLRLDLNKMSLYSEVRNQPKVGFLSTIESIVYALKAVGEDPEGLDRLLDVFESMVGDQRRCKDERLNKETQV